MAAVVDVSDSQRLIAVSLGKIAASRGQRGGINLHKNLLVATVLHKARTAYMMEHVAARQRAQQAVSPLATTTTTTVPPSANSETTNNVVSNSMPVAASPSLSAPLASVPHTSRPEVSRAESGSASENADVSRVQMEEAGDDKENTPPSPTPQHPDTSSSNSADCEMRLHQDNSPASESKDLKDKNGSSLSHAQQTTQGARDYVSNGKSCSSCLLKRRRGTDRDNENGVAPKVRILEYRVSTESTPEPMQVESPQISNLVNIFTSGFSGLCPNGTEGDSTTTTTNGRSHVGQLSTVSPILASHKLASESNMMCGKQMKACMDSVPQAIALTV